MCWWTCSPDHPRGHHPDVKQDCCSRRGLRHYHRNNHIRRNSECDHCILCHRGSHIHASESLLQPVQQQTSKYADACQQLCESGLCHRRNGCQCLDWMIQGSCLSKLVCLDPSTHLSVLISTSDPECSQRAPSTCV